ncbi:Hint domain-containing protein [Ancylobacter oerskovii]|uniref:Hint domain-containing protein n=1 Tax=Ancylobacter oerskovii TaxID=459519 RepID=A0ABW4Z0C3_9HYPH|nr:Hint domain-containing protein [Ancylobacter oerskovii]MBS7542817.1 Hint domain-containing protein [Ancylobacter oerskovii]
MELTLPFTYSVDQVDGTTFTVTANAMADALIAMGITLAVAETIEIYADFTTNDDIVAVGDILDAPTLSASSSPISPAIVAALTPIYSGSYVYLGEGPDPGSYVMQQVGGTGEIFLFGASSLNIGDDFSVQPTDILLCFLAGTGIATPAGTVAVECLSIGELVSTADGRAVPVKWIGRKSAAPLFLAEERRPVRIGAGALGAGLPVRDLDVTGDHALLIDGLLVQAGALVNGTTIRRLSPDELGARFTVYHIETERHDLVLAEGVPAETFVDNVSRRRFDNHAEYEALYGAGSCVPERELPRVKSARQLPARLRERLAGRSAA